MNIYRVTGEVPHKYYCTCSHCEGHFKLERVNRLVEAANAEEAFYRVVPHDYDGDDDELSEKVVVTEATQAQVMEFLGMRTLFDLEPAP